jgi:hypothetical protein
MRRGPGDGGDSAARSRPPDARAIRRDASTAHRRTRPDGATCRLARPLRTVAAILVPTRSNLVPQVPFRQARAGD